MKKAVPGESQAPIDISPNGARRDRAPAEVYGAPHDGLALADVATVLRRHIRTVVTGALLGLAIVAAVVSVEPRLYRATAVVRLTDPRRSIVQGLEDPTNRAESQRISPLQSEIQLLRSRAVIGAVVDSQGLRIHQASPRSPTLTLLESRTTASAVDDDTLALSFDASRMTIRNRGGSIAYARYGVPARIGGVSFTIPTRPATSRATLVVEPREVVSDQLLLTVRVEPRLETDVVDVSVTMDDPAQARDVVNTLVSVFREASVRAAQAQSRRRREFLEGQLQEIALQLARAEKALVNFRSRQHAYSSRAQIEAQQSALMSLDMRRQELDADRRMYQSLLGRMQHAPNDSGGTHPRSTISAQDLSGNPVIAQLYDRLAQYENARDSLTTGEWRSTATNPDVTRLNSLVASAEQRLVGAVAGHVAALDARLSALNDLRARSVASISALPLAESAETKLVRQVETNRAMDDRLREEYQKARMAEEVEAGRVEILDLAEKPYRPIRSLLGLKLGFGLFAGLLLGGAIALLRERSKASIRRRRELEAQVGIPALAIIPNIYARIPARHRFPFGILRGGDRAAQQRRTRIPIQSLPAASVSFAGNEAYRLLHANLCWLQGTQPLKTIVIASALGHEGKTTVAANLALSFALEGRRTLLIDADLRRPRVHRAFRLTRAPGLAQCLAGHVGAATAIRTTFVDQLFVLPAGHADSSPALLFRAGPMRDLIADCAERFDTIIIDTPPVFAAADAAIVSPLADGVLFVVQAGRTEPDVAQQAFQQLVGVGAHVVGAVLNDPNGETGHYGEKYASYGYADTYVGGVYAAQS